MTRIIDKTTGEYTDIPWDGTEMTEAQLVTLLARLYDLKRSEREARHFYDTYSRPVRAWLDQHPGETLRDGERGILARLQLRQGTDTLDIAALADADPTLLVWLARVRALKLDLEGWRAQLGKSREAEQCRGFVHKAGSSMALLIDKEERHGHDRTH